MQKVHLNIDSEKISIESLNYLNLSFLYNYSIYQGNPEFAEDVFNFRVENCFYYLIRKDDDLNVIRRYIFFDKSKPGYVTNFFTVESELSLDKKLDFINDEAEFIRRKKGLTSYKRLITYERTIENEIDFNKLLSTYDSIYFEKK